MSSTAEAFAGVLSIQPDDGTELATQALSAGMVALTASAADGRPGLKVEVDLADAVGYWQPGLRTARALPADWVGVTVTSLVQSAPIGALYDAAGDVLLGWAAGEGVAELSVRFGVSEERKSFSIELRPLFPLDDDLVVVLDGTRRRLAETVRSLVGWLSQQCPGAARAVPEMARQPVYSTWYALSQHVSNDLISSEAARAAKLGLGSVFIDDGWQRLGHGRGYRGCGDWIPDPAKFENLAQTVQTLHDRGLAVALWIAPLLLGPVSDAFPDLRRFAPHWEPAHDCHVLDPRYPQVREHLAAVCLRLVQDYDVDLLKIDFLDRAMAYRDARTGADISDVGHAMAALLGEVRRTLADAGRDDVAFEFRQPYASPAIARYGEILRANDCPGDSVVNRMTSLDARLVSAGQIVHSDPMMWGLTGGAEAVAQQLYAGWFSVPQISMRLTELPPSHTEALSGLLALWREHAEVTLGGDLDVSGPEHGFSLVRAERADLRRSVVAAYAPLVVDLGAEVGVETSVLNATSADRLVLRTTQPVLGGVVRSASGARVAELHPADPGLIQLAVPPFGSITAQT